MPPQLEIRIPISPNPHFMRMARYLMSSIQVFGGPIARSARVVFSVSRDAEFLDLEDAYPWTRRFDCAFRWIDPQDFAEREYEATGSDRFFVKSTAEVVLFMDADTLVAGDFDHLVRDCHQHQSYMGFIAHASPFKGNEVSSQAWWSKLCRAAGLQPPDFAFRYTAWGLKHRRENQQWSPPYFNFGVVMAPRPMMERLATTFNRDLATVRREYDHFFQSQIANTLSILRHRLPCRTLPINANFPLNWPADPIRGQNPNPDGKNRDEDIMIFHYLGEGEVNKSDFKSEASLDHLLNRTDLSPTASMFQQRLRTVHQWIQQQDSDLSPRPNVKGATPVQ